MSRESHGHLENTPLLHKAPWLADTSAVDLNAPVMAGCAIEEPILNPSSQENRISVEWNSPYFTSESEGKDAQRARRYKSFALWLAVTVD
jgi:hypothetical protein